MHQSWFNKFKICFDGEKRRVDHIRVVGLYVRWSLDTFLTSSLPQELEMRFCVEMHTYRETASELVQTSILPLLCLHVEQHTSRLLTWSTSPPFSQFKHHIPYASPGLPSPYISLFSDLRHHPSGKGCMLIHFNGEGHPSVSNAYCFHTVCNPIYCGL